MSMQDPISDMFSCIRNGQATKKKEVSIFSSKIKKNIIRLLVEEGYVNGYKIIDNVKPILIIFLKYFRNKPVIELMQRISSPGLRVYKKNRDLPQVNSGMGIAIISTSKGIMTDKIARRYNLGGEIICYIS